MVALWSDYNYWLLITFVRTCHTVHCTSRQEFAFCGSGAIISLAGGGAMEERWIMSWFMGNSKMGNALYSVRSAAPAVGGRSVWHPYVRRTKSSWHITHPNVLHPIRIGSWVSTSWLKNALLTPYSWWLSPTCKESTYFLKPWALPTNSRLYKTLSIKIWSLLQAALLKEKALWVTRNHIMLHQNNSFKKDT